MEKFLKFFTKTVIAFRKFTDKEGQFITLIKSNEFAFIIFIVFAKTLTKTLSQYILNYITSIYRFFSYKKFLTLKFFTFTDKVNPLNIFHIIRFLK